MHTIIEQITVTVHDPVRLEWVLERSHILPVEPRPGMQVRDQDKHYVWRIPSDLILQRRMGRWEWLNENRVSQSVDKLEEYLRVMQDIHHYTLVKIPKVSSKNAAVLEKALEKSRYEVSDDGAGEAGVHKPRQQPVSQVQGAGDKVPEHAAH